MAIQRKRITTAVLLLTAICGLIAVGLATWVVLSEEFVGGYSTHYWIERLRDSDPEVRVETIRKLCLVGLTDSQVIELLLHATSDHDAQVRARAAFALGSVGYRAYDIDCGVIGVSGEQIRADDRRLVVTALGGLLQDEDERVREAAADAMGVCGPEAIQPAMSLLDSSRPELQQSALRALGKSRRAKNDRRVIFDRDAVAAATRFRDLVAQPDVVIRRLAIRTIHETDFGPRELRVLLPCLLASLNDEDREVRHEAVFAFRVFGWSEKASFGVGLQLSSEAESAVTALREIAKSDDENVAYFASKAVEVLLRNGSQQMAASTTGD